MLGALINRLIMSGRSAEVGKVATDSNFRNKLYQLWQSTTSIGYNPDIPHGRG